MVKRRLRIGQYVKVKGLKDTCGKITFTRVDEGVIKHRVRESNGTTRFFNQSSLRKSTAKACKPKR